MDCWGNGSYLENATPHPADLDSIRRQSNLWMHWADPGSYTHLDVYKRQHLRASGKNLDCPAIDWNHERHPRGAMRAYKAVVYHD